MIEHVSLSLPGAPRFSIALALLLYIGFLMVLRHPFRQLALQVRASISKSYHFRRLRVQPMSISLKLEQLVR